MVVLGFRELAEIDLSYLHDFQHLQIRLRCAVGYQTDKQRDVVYLFQMGSNSCDSRWELGLVWYHGNLKDRKSNGLFPSTLSRL